MTLRQVVSVFRTLNDIGCCTITTEEDHITIGYGPHYDRTTIRFEADKKEKTVTWTTTRVTTNEASFHDLGMEEI